MPRGQAIASPEQLVFQYHDVNTGIIVTIDEVDFVIVAGLEGDFNEDGVVDAADYVWWRKNDGDPGGYATWRANFGARESGSGATPLASAAAPEPSALALGGLLIALMSAVRFGRRFAK